MLTNQVNAIRIMPAKQRGVIEEGKMIVKVFSGVQVGDFVRGHGHCLNPNLTQVWWKVTEVTRDEITAVNRHGRVRRLTFDQCRQIGIRFKVWQPGDPREDGDNL